MKRRRHGPKQIIDRLRDAERISKSRKPIMRRAADDDVRLIGDQVSLDYGPVTNTVRAYLRNYRLAKHFNGIRSLLIVSRIVDTIKKEAATASGLDRIVDRVRANRPSSYAMRGSTFVALMESRRRIQAPARATKTEEPHDMPLIASR